jgi:uncharacterized protein (TIGR02001 family)
MRGLAPTLFGALILAGSAVPQPAVAQQKLKPKVTFNLGANNDYVFRGISQSDEDPSVFGGVDASVGALYAGLWASNVDFGNGTDAEIAAYAGIRPKLSSVTLDFGAIYYGYVDAPRNAHQDYWEAKAAASVPAGPATLGAALYYSPEFFGRGGEAWYYEASAAVAIPNTRFSVDGVVGRQNHEKSPDYTTWNAALGYAVDEHLKLEIRYWDTAKDRYGAISSSRIVAGFKVSY